MEDWGFGIAIGIRAGRQYREELGDGESIASLPGAEAASAAETPPVDRSTEMTCTGGKPMSDFATTR